MEKPLEVLAPFRLVKEIRALLTGCVLSSRHRAQPQNTQANSIIGLRLLQAPHIPAGSMVQGAGLQALGAHQLPNLQGLVQIEMKKQGPLQVVHQEGRNTP